MIHGNTKKILTISIIAVAIFFAVHNNVSAFEYKLLEAFPGFFSKGSSPNLPDMILAIYKFGIWTVGICGLLMITIGGVMYMGSAGNNANAESAKRIITDSLIGIVAALGAYLFMYVINPDLTVIRLSLTTAKTSTSSATKTVASIPEAKTTTTTADAGAAVAHGEVISAAKKMMDQGCLYSKPKRNGCTGTPGYTDCSNFVCTAYKNAGCTCPGNVSGDYGAKAKSIDSPSSLKAGDVIWTQGHVVMCTADGCSKVIAAAGEDKGIKYSNGSFYYNKGKVVRASDYCK